MNPWIMFYFVFICLMIFVWFILSFFFSSLRKMSMYFGIHLRWFYIPQRFAYRVTRLSCGRVKGRESWRLLGLQEERETRRMRWFGLSRSRGRYCASARKAVLPVGLLGICTFLADCKLCCKTCILRFKLFSFFCLGISISWSYICPEFIACVARSFLIEIISEKVKFSFWNLKRRLINNDNIIIVFAIYKIDIFQKNIEYLLRNIFRHILQFLLFIVWTNIFIITNKVT